MDIKNSAQSYGVVSKFLHWVIFLLILVQLFSIFWVNYVLPENSAEQAFWIGQVHKPAGMLTLILVILALLWKAVNIHPNFPQQMPNWEKTAARWNHGLLWICLIIMPVSGLIMSVAEARPPNFFGLYVVPQFIPENKTVGNIFFAIHAITAIILIFSICLHILAAIKHHFIDKDDVLKRML